jgi:acetyl esterase/lipase
LPADVVSAYRLAPEHPYPAPVEDCYAGLVWLAEHATELGADPDRIVVAGPSAGGLYAAATALLARDRNGPRLAGQTLLSPALDDRNDTVSARQMAGLGIWDRASNEMG